VIAFCGDGSYLMMNSDLYSSVLTGKKIIAIVCDNGGYAVIERLQIAQGNAAYRNMLEGPRVDFVAHAAAMGCRSERVSSLAALEVAMLTARQADRSTVIVVETAAQAWTEAGGSFWEVGVPEISDRQEIDAARERLDEGKQFQRRGV
jgi:3D-(3,5/4)-trihydroxycyclohexane-1,2-dione acylhydrolase (decyclizing)